MPWLSQWNVNLLLSSWIFQQRHDDSMFDVDWLWINARPKSRLLGGFQWPSPWLTVWSIDREGGEGKAECDDEECVIGTNFTKITVTSWGEHRSTSRPFSYLWQLWTDLSNWEKHVWLAVLPKGEWILTKRSARANNGPAVGVASRQRCIVWLDWSKSHMK